MNAYAAAALAQEVQRVRSTTERRGPTAYAAACNLGELVGARLLDPGQATESLVEAAISTGLSEKEARSHVSRGIAKGMESPRDVPSSAGRERTIHVGRETQPSPRPPKHVPEADALRFWSQCTPVTSDAKASQIVRARGLDPDAIELWDLARGIPDGRLPPWAWSKAGSWHKSGHVLILPMFDVHGTLRSFRARRQSRHDPKVVVPRGYEATALFFACPLMQQVLRDGVPQWWSDSKIGIEVVEGGPDFLTVASRRSEAHEEAPATLGVVSGSSKAEILGRIPARSRVVLATHADKAGADYTLQIGRILKHHCEVVVSPVGARP